jgi:hypothetical protein
LCAGTATVDCLTSRVRCGPDAVLDVTLGCPSAYVRSEDGSEYVAEFTRVQHSFNSVRVHVGEISTLHTTVTLGGFMV